MSGDVTSGKCSVEQATRFLAIAFGLILIATILALVVLVLAVGGFAPVLSGRLHARLNWSAARRCYRQEVLLLADELIEIR